MSPKTSGKYHFKLYAFLFIAFLSLSIVLGHFFKNDFDPDKLISHIEKKIELKDKAVLTELQYLQNFYQKKPDSIFDLIDRYKDVYHKKGYFFLILKNDSLTFWSDNNASVSIEAIKDSSKIINSGNGWYRKINIRDGIVTYAGLYLIKQNYNYQNDYLENDFHESFGLDPSTTFSLDPDEAYKFFDRGGSFLFSLAFDANAPLNNHELTILFLLYIITFIFLIALLYTLHLFIYHKTGKFILFIFGFITDLLLLRIAIFYFEIPHVLHESTLFSPFYYAYSDLIPSIADLFLNALVLLFISFFIFYHVKFNLKNLNKRLFHKYFVVFTLFLHIFIFYKGIDFVFKSLIIDSSISLDLNNIFTLSWLSFVNFLIVATFILSYILISSKLSFFAYQYCKNIYKYSFFAIIAFSVFTLFCTISQPCDYWPLVFVLGYILSFGMFYKRREYKFNVGNILFYIFLFSIISTYSLHKYNSFKEREYRKLLAVNLSSEQRDPIAEYMFQRESDRIYSDETLFEFLNAYGSSQFDYDKFYNYFTNRYFTGYWKKYDCQITICTPEDVLILQPDDYNVNCVDYFEDRIQNDGLPTESPEFYFLKYSPGENGYIAILDFSDSPVQHSALNVFIELYPKYTARDLGFPDLLVDKAIDKNPDLTSYSYAKYQDGELYKRVGEYFYNFNLSQYATNANGQFTFFNQNGYNHLIYKFGDGRSLIISVKQKSILDILAPFSYLFLFFILFSGCIFFIFIFPFSRKSTTLSFRTRLQISISSVILISFFVIGMFTLFYINNLNDEKNRDLLSEKTHSVLVEIQHKFSGTSYFDDENAVLLSELLVKFSSVFFTDINMFDLNGQLISSSRPQIYDEQLISRTINPRAFKALSLDNSSLFIHNENIGKQTYLSAYIPFVNSMGDVIAYLNLPYFAKENDLNKEISTFLVAYINIYVILIAISLLIAILISNYISRPIKMIMTKIREVKLGGQNETIQWNRKDEIGQLVEEYNRMIDELAQSAELLAKSERESAWREMAKQIAHEIKNPLTPMKLSVQYLQRAWQNESPEWENRLEKFTQTMIEQIDALSIIASEFSDFAKMPISQKSNTDLVEVIKSTISLFKTYHNIQFDFDCADEEGYLVFADKEQLIRAFNNLFKNAIQAIGMQADGKVEIRLKKQFQDIIVEIADNGEGISDEISAKIFSPNFTTKSGGMGLGLAIVKNIIINSGGEISYKSQKGDGATFFIKLPIA